MHPIYLTLYVAQGGFPRARGDAPDLVLRAGQTYQFPPRTRGCTRGRAALGVLVEVFPAHAGMHPGKTHRIFTHPGFPRARGDAPITNYGTRLLKKFPPRTRGCTHVHVGLSGHLSVSPAHAGMHPKRPRRACRRRCFPRARGDAPLAFMSRMVFILFPPRTRGCTHVGVAHHAPYRVSPAHAGMHPSTLTSPTAPTRFPRARGDAPIEAIEAIGIERFPPRTRGCTLPCHRLSSSPLVSPAHAGMHL